jgi:hypothetical protein
MRKQLLKGLTTLGVFLTLFVGTVQAQTGSRIDVNIPFNFTAGESSLPAGSYSVKLISENMLLVRSTDGKKNVLLLARQSEPLRTEKPSRIIFNRYGDRYFLSQAWVDGEGVGTHLNPSRAERQLVREFRLAKGNAKSQRVEVAVR